MKDAAFILTCRLSVCPASDLGNYARYARHFVTSIRNRGWRARTWRQILCPKRSRKPKNSSK